MNDERDILATLDEYADAYCAKDIDRLMALFVGGDDISLIGTGADELCSGRSEVRAIFLRNFSQATAERFEWGWRHVTVEGNCAVVATAVTIHLQTDEGRMKVAVRWTVSLVRQSGSWLWLHRHASAASGSQEDGTAYPQSND